MIRTPTILPDARGRFGEYGGRFVPETLVPALDELEAAWQERPSLHRIPHRRGRGPRATANHGRERGGPQGFDLCRPLCLSRAACRAARTKARILS